MGFLLSNWKIFAAIGAVIAVIIAASQLVNLGGSKEQAKVAKEIHKNVGEANEIQSKNLRSSDADITKRLLRWQRD